MARRKKQSEVELIVGIVLTLVVIITGYFSYINEKNVNEISSQISYVSSVNLEEIPKYKSEPYVIINNNMPKFTEDEKISDVFEKYSELDSLGRCGVAFANICKEIMPKDGETRGEIGMIKPSGWQTIRYNGIVEGNYLYNRCHLIGWQLAGENANKNNLITGTRYLNVQGMLPFENLIDDYFEKAETKDNHVLYRVTPIFEGDNLIASGVQMEAYSIEDKGEGICFNVFVYNVQPGIEINYKTGESKLAE